MPHKFRTGALPRAHYPEVPHYSAVRTMRKFQLPSLPHEAHNAANVPKPRGVMGNDKWGDCPAAAIGHLIEICTLDAQGQMLTVPDDLVLQFYAEVSGCDLALGPGNPTDQGAVLQDVLAHLVKVGFPMPDGTRMKAISFVEVDPRSPTDLCEVAMECGAIYSGFLVPADLPEDGNSELWSGLVDLGQNSGAHCVLEPGFVNPANPTFDTESWGLEFQQDWPFWHRYQTEAYGVILPSWIEKTGKTPWGLDLDTLAAFSNAVRRR